MAKDPTIPTVARALRTSVGASRDKERCVSSTCRCSLGCTYGVRPKGRYVNELPQALCDISSYQWLQFRVALDFTDARNQKAARNFTIRIEDLDGRAATARGGQFPQALSYPPGEKEDIPKVVL